MPKKQTKKQPINVQLSKDDLKELLMVLKNFLQEEIQGISRVQDHRLDCHNQRMIVLESNQQKFETYKSLCVHDTHFDSVDYFTSRISGRIIYRCLRYKCSRCGLIIERHPWMLSRKEKKALKLLGVKI